MTNCHKCQFVLDDKMTISYRFQVVMMTKCKKQQIVAIKINYINASEAKAKEQGFSGYKIFVFV